MPDENQSFGSKVVENIPVIGGLLGGIFDSVSNSKSQKSAQKHEIDMWNRQNAYNTPAEQQKRLKEAGLNPALMYGNGSTGNASGRPQTINKAPSQVGKGMSQTSLATLQALQQKKENARADDMLQGQLEVYKAQALKAQSETNWNNLSMPQRLEALKGKNYGQTIQNTYNDRTLNSRVEMQHHNSRYANNKNLQIEQMMEQSDQKFQEWLNDKGHRQKMQSASLTSAQLKNKYQRSLNMFAEKGLALSSSEYGALITTILNDPKTEEIIDEATTYIKDFNEGSNMFKKGVSMLSKLKIFTNPMEMAKAIKTGKL